MDRAKDFIATLWAIWIHRNNVVFRNLQEHPSSILERKAALLKELTESSKIREFYFPRSSSSINNLEENIDSANAHHQEVCTILVDGAWKHLNHHHPGAGIGWPAFVNNIKAFEGSAEIIALSPLQTKAHAMYKGMCEAHTKGFIRVQVLSDSAELVRAIESQHQPFEISRFSTLIHDIKAMHSKLSVRIICKVSRLEMVPAHVLVLAARIGKM